MSFPLRIKQRREELKISRPELAKKIGVTVSAIGNYETGVSHPKVDILYKLFQALNVDANFLFQDEMISLKKSPNMANANSEDLTNNEKVLLDDFRKLNDDGKEVVLDHMEYILTKAKYIKCDKCKFSENMDA